MDDERDRLAEKWLLDRHSRDWYISDATFADWREAYLAVDTARTRKADESGDDDSIEPPSEAP